MRRSSQKQGQQFVARVTEHLRRLGAVEVEPPYPPEIPGARFSLVTPAGLLSLHPDANRVGGPGSVFCRFDDAARAQTLGIDCNPHSGKWNHHYFSGTVDEAVESFVRALDGLLAQGRRCPHCGRLAIHPGMP